MSFTITFLVNTPTYHLVLEQVIIQKDFDKLFT